MSDARPRKRCSGKAGCGLEKPIEDFSVSRRDPLAYHGTCKACRVTLAVARARRVRAAARQLQPVHIAGLPDVPRSHTSVVLPTEVRVKLSGPDYDVPPLPPPPPLPVFGTTPECSRGLHEWPVETVCKGHETLGCGGLELHVHRRCPIHCTEEIEAAPACVTGLCGGDLETCANVCRGRGGVP